MPICSVKSDSDSMDYSSPGSSVHGVLQTKILERLPCPFSRGSSRLRDLTCISFIAGIFFTHWAAGEAQNTAYVTVLKNWREDVKNCYRCIHHTNNSKYLPTFLIPQFLTLDSRNTKFLWTKLPVSQTKEIKLKVIKLAAKLLFLGKRKQTLPDVILDVLRGSDQSQKQEL